MGADDIDFDEEFPLADGTADNTADVFCPYCGESVTIAIDAGGGSFQQYVEDCQVCCNPWQVSVRFTGGAAAVEVTPME